jgi:hypothetical protein
LLYDGDGEFDFFGNLSVQSEEPGRIILNFKRSINDDGVFGLTLTRSDTNNHVRNIRLLMPGTENTYQTMPYYSEWFSKLQPFKVIRFMDWGQTNNWGHNSAWECYDEDSDTARVPWNERAKLSSYTWATNKGVPYEVMIDLCNKLHSDMWICVPYIADNDFIRQLALLLKNNLDPSLKIYVEYGNENWNWMFGQTQWLNTFGCVKKGVSWPEGIVPYIQNCMDIFSDVFDGEMGRITRVVGVQAAWLDVSQRIVNNIRPGSFDAFAPAAYFGINESVDSALDNLGASATVQDIVTRVRSVLKENEIQWLKDQKKFIGDEKNIPMLFYEGGQHFTPTPFGEEPTYSQALLDVQRDSSMYNLYSEWFKFLETLIPSGKEGLFMNFSFIGQRSARYGSWGVLESLTQDTGLIPAPKYKAILDYMSSTTTTVDNKSAVICPGVFQLEQNYPNPFNPVTAINYTIPVGTRRGVFVQLKVYDLLGKEVAVLVNEEKQPGNYHVVFDAGKYNLSNGIYFYRINAGKYSAVKKLVLLK